MPKKNITNLRVISPTSLFYLIVFIFNIIPSVIILLTDYIPIRVLLTQEDFNKSKLLYFYALILFISSFTISRIIIALVKRKGKLIKSVNFTNLKAETNLYFVKANKWIVLSFIISLLLILLYAFNGGIQKMALLGSDLDGREFRFMGFNEIPRHYTAGLAIARRFVLPLIIVFLYIKHIFSDYPQKTWLFLAIFLQLFASALTFARAPFLTLIVGIFVVKLLVTKNKALIIIYSSLLLFLIMIMAGTITNLQYNITTFDITGILSTGLDFLANRAWFVPNVVPINLTFSDINLFSDPLYLKYSRLGGLLGLGVVGTLETNSVYVAPVGYIGDIWRNFSWLGLIFFGGVFAMLFSHLDKAFSKLTMFGSLIFIFLLVAMIFYWIMGVIFSQGSIFSIAIIYIFIYLDSNIKKTINRTLNKPEHD